MRAKKIGTMRIRRGVAKRLIHWAPPRVLAALGVLAMLTPALTPIASTDLAAYRPDHGHLHAAGVVVPDHDHPWDDHRTRARDASTLFDALAFHPVAADIAPDDSSTVEQHERTGIVFTHGDDGSPGSASGLALPGVGTALAVAADTIHAAASVTRTPADHPLLVPTQPPRL
ncbi:MAG: hypothetical protein OXH97_08290 [Chloroflexota bacterium]|nr:hypothetical protein [Chloroflexota bacterium]